MNDSDFFDMKAEPILSDIERIREAMVQTAQANACNLAALVELLIRKGVIGEREFSDLVASMESHTDQLLASKRFPLPPPAAER